MHEAKTNLSRIVSAVEAGEVDEVEIARAGRVVALIVPQHPAPGRQPGYWAGRVVIHDDFETLPEDLAASDFLTLGISAEHALAAGRLPAHHNDPFDRMLIAQSRIEKITLVSVDGRFEAYDVDLLPLA